MDVKITRSPSQTTVTVAGDLDYASSPGFLTELLPLIESGSLPVVAVLDGVEFIDSSGVGTLLWAHRRADPMGSEFKVAAPSAVVAGRLAQLGLDRHLYLVDVPVRRPGGGEPSD